ncbi:MAG: type II toxin-antitoxin system VapC family toxin [Gammaproteobacteria bacterium]
MKFVLDTNICIFIIKQKPPQVLKQFKNYEAEDIGISAITLAELQFGVVKSQHREKNQQALNEFILPLAVLEFNSEAAFVYGEVRAGLTRTGQLIGALDMLIAAQALSANATLVTNNVREFARVTGLRVENWIEPSIS